ncbi:unnamed protein product, partial [Heligmosomoides polygyrus]|uniref:Actin-related protein 10 n=1 Tax=Heligmosomoides polygyrus TaxID=6339 RepID=A0A183GN47_HELPZ
RSQYFCFPGRSRLHPGFIYLAYVIFFKSGDGFPEIDVDLNNVVRANVFRVGYAGEFVPRAIIHSHLLDETIYEDADVDSEGPRASRMSLARAVKFFRNIFNSYLLTMPRERRVVIVESLLTPTQFRETVCEALLGVLNVPSVLFIPSHLCATFSFNTEYALVVDVAYREALAVPVGVTSIPLIKGLRDVDMVRNMFDRWTATVRLTSVMIVRNPLMGLLPAVAYRVLLPPSADTVLLSLTEASRQA